MATDHSKTYKLNDVRNVAHVLRLRAILRILRAKIKYTPRTYADFGCSNGFITNKIADLFDLSDSTGYDYSDNVIVGSRLYPKIRFERLDLNVVHDNIDHYDLVTCFETLEHVGNLESAVANVCQSRAPEGSLLISVPIEIGFIGIIKYAIKRILFRYDLPLMCNDFQYITALIRGERISRFRAPESGYGSHFGFDYRDVDDLVVNHAGALVKIQNSVTTRFYFIGKD